MTTFTLEQYLAFIREGAEKAKSLEKQGIGECAARLRGILSLYPDREGLEALVLVVLEQMAEQGMKPDK